jgi:hypothetical protein
MAEQQGLAEHVRNWKPSKAALLWACAGTFALTLIVGFNWGGWVTGGTAEKMAARAQEEGRAKLAATICVNKFMAAPDARANLATLKKTDSWERDSFVTKGGWVKLPGVKEPIFDAASLCAEQLAKMQPAKTEGAASAATVAN